MGDRGGSSRPGCKWHLRQQGEGVCAICLRTSLEKLAAYQGEYQESLDTYTRAFLSTSFAEFSRERESNAQSFQPTYPSVSYRSRSKKELKSKGGMTSEDGGTSNSREAKDATSSKATISWGVAVHRIASLRNTLTSFWKSVEHSEEKGKQNTEVRTFHYGKPHGQNRAEEERKEKFCGQQHAANSETPRLFGDVKHDLTSSVQTTPLTGSSTFVSKFTHRSSTPDGYQAWWRSKSSREAKHESHVFVSTDYGHQTAGGNQAHDALSPIQSLPHRSSRSSPWRFFSRSGSRRSPQNGLNFVTLKPTPKGSTASDSRQYPVMTSDCRSSPSPRGFAAKPAPGDCISKSLRSSPSMVNPDPTHHVSFGSHITSWSRTLSPRNKLRPLHITPRTVETKRDSVSRDSIDAQESVDLFKPVDIQGQRGTRLIIDGVQESTSPPSREENTLSPMSDSSMKVPFTAQNKTDSLSFISVTRKPDWPRVMLVKASKALLFKRPKILRGGHETRKLGSGSPLQMTGRGQASTTL